MDLYVEKEFIEEFELEYYCSDSKTEVQKIIYSLFVEFTGIHLFLTDSQNFINSSELLTKFTDNNLQIDFNFSFETSFDDGFIPKTQTLVFTRTQKKWFAGLKQNGVLCFSFDDYELEIKRFIEKTHFKIDLSDRANIPFNRNSFIFLNEQTSFVIINDPYILCDNDGQKIKNNLIPLLKENLNKNNSYSIFLLTKVDNEIDKKIGQLNSALNGYKVKVFVFNILQEFENLDLHDRVLYTNYTMTDSGKGFNLNTSKPSNSQIVSASIFEKHTYKRFNSHIKELEKYIGKLEKSENLNNPYRTNTKKAFEAFRQII
jgi:hypothetical protein